MKNEQATGLVVDIGKVFYSHDMRPAKYQLLIYSLADFVLDYHRKSTEELIDNVFAKKKGGKKDG